MMPTEAPDLTLTHDLLRKYTDSPEHFRINHYVSVLDAPDVDTAPVLFPAEGSPSADPLVVGEQLALTAAAAVKGRLAAVVAAALAQQPKRVTAARDAIRACASEVFVCNPFTAKSMSKIVQDMYCQEVGVDTAAAAITDGENPNRKYGLPRAVGGVRIVVENMIHAVADHKEYAFPSNMAIGVKVKDSPTFTFRFGKRVEPSLDPFGVLESFELDVNPDTLTVYTWN